MGKQGSDPLCFPLSYLVAMGTTVRLGTSPDPLCFPLSYLVAMGTTVTVTVVWYYLVAMGTTVRLAPHLTHCAFPYLTWSQWARRFG